MRKILKVRIIFGCSKKIFFWWWVNLWLISFIVGIVFRCVMKIR